MRDHEIYQAFVEVAHTGSFTKAAANLGRSRVKLSRDVRELEDFFKVRLFHRTTRRVSLTEPGRDLLPTVEDILARIEGMRHRATQHTKDLVGTLRIAAPAGFARSMLVDLVQRFMAKHTGVTVDMVLSDKLTELVADRVDLAMRFTGEPDASFIGKRLFEVELCLCAAPAYLKDAPPLESIEDLTKHNALVHADHDFWQFVEEGGLVSVSVAGNMTADDYNVILNGVLAGVGLGLLPSDIINPYLREGTLVQLLPDAPGPSMPLWALYLSRSYQRQIVRAFIDFATENWKSDVRVFRKEI